MRASVKCLRVDWACSYVELESYCVGDYGEVAVERDFGKDILYRCPCELDLALCFRDGVHNEEQLVASFRRCWKPMDVELVVLHDAALGCS